MICSIIKAQSKSSLRLIMKMLGAEDVLCAGFAFTISNWPTIREGVHNGDCLRNIGLGSSCSHNKWNSLSAIQD
ncbi:MAG: hypothetical protein HXM74_06945 [Mogibacterium diversum]|nr:hypothetical protein [Mogibacterium diversum]